MAVQLPALYVVVGKSALSVTWPVLSVMKTLPRENFLGVLEALLPLRKECWLR